MRITQTTKVADLSKSERSWIVIDAGEKVLGRVASEVARLLKGKDKIDYTPNFDLGDNVVVVNLNKVKVTGKKLNEKEYKYYSGYPGGLKVFKMADLKKRRPTEFFRHAVYGMLPKNKLRDSRIKRLYAFMGSEHPFTEKLN